MAITVVSIDQGQSNTKVAVSDRGVLALFRETEPDGLYPSQVSFSASGVEVGTRAAAGGNRDPVNFVKGWKMFVGEKKVYTAGGKRRTPIEMSALMVSEVVKDVLEGINKGLDDVHLTLTVPVTYDGKTIDEYIGALEALGVKVLPQYVFQEPLAAAYHYAKIMGEDVVGKTVLVIDIGGSTLDVIRGVVEAAGQSYRISVSSMCGEKLAGSKFDAIVKADILDQMRGNGLDDSNLSPKDELMVAKKAISIKERLSSGRDVHDVVNLSSGSYEVDVRFDKYRTDCGELVEKILGVIGETMEDGFWGVDMVAMVGGTSMIPFLKGSITERFPELDGKISCEDPLNCVVFGATELAVDMISNSSKGRHIELYRRRSPKTISVTSRKAMGGTEVIRGFPHVMKGDMSPKVVHRTYAIPDNAADELQSDILVSDHEEMDEDFDPYDEGVQKLGTLIIPIPDHKKEGTPIELSIEFMANGLIRASSSCEGLENKAEFRW